MSTDKTADTTTTAEPPTPGGGGQRVAFQLSPEPGPKPWGHDLWKHLADNHGVTLVLSELQEVVRCAAPLAEGELQRSFEMRWNADMRAIQRWRAEMPGRELSLPDHADLCVWLLEQLEKSEARVAYLDGEAERKEDSSNLQFQRLREALDEAAAPRYIFEAGKDSVFIGNSPEERVVAFGKDYAALKKERDAYKLDADQANAYILELGQLLGGADGEDTPALRIAALKEAKAQADAEVKRLQEKRVELVERNRTLNQAVADAAKEIDNLRKNPVRAEVFARFGQKMLTELIQGEWSPDADWHMEMLELAEEEGLLGRRPPQPEDGVDESVTQVWEILYPQGKADDWQPMDTAPMDGTAVLAKLPDSDCPVVVRMMMVSWQVCWDNCPLMGVDEPTHWMPLPPVPEA